MARFAFPVVVVASVVASLGLSAWRLAHRPSDADLDAAADRVRAAFRNGDVIIVEPRFLVGPRARLGDLELIEPRSLTAEDLSTYRRAHLITVPAVRQPESFDELLDELGEQEVDERLGRVRLRRYRLPEPEPVLFDLWQDIARVRVTAFYADGVAAPCERFEIDRWICPRNSQWSYVGRTIMDVDGQPRVCVWLHPLHARDLLTVELPAIAGVVAISGGYGFSADAARRAAAPVDLRILAGDIELHRGHHPVQPGWQRFRAPARQGQVRIQVSSTNNGAAHFCFAARLLGARS